MNNIAELIRNAKGRESMIEDIVHALAKLNGFDKYLPLNAPRPVHIKHNRRGRPDVELLDVNYLALLGIEVKITSQINVARYGDGEIRTQFDEMAKHFERLVIVTNTSRLERDRWPKGAVLLTLDDLARIAEEVSLTADHIVRVGLGYDL